VSALTFTINPKAKFNDAFPERQSTRDILRRSQSSRASPSDVPQGHDMLGNRGKTALINNVTSPISREEFIAGVVCPSNAVAQVKQSKYKRYLISTTLRMNGTWVACYGRPRPIKAPTEIDEEAVAESEPFLAEALALADARVCIDDREKKSHVPRRQGRHQIVTRRLFKRVAGHDQQTVPKVDIVWTSVRVKMINCLTRF
jgi:hypothetical protein